MGIQKWELFLLNWFTNINFYLTIFKFADKSYLENGSAQLYIGFGFFSVGLENGEAGDYK